MAVVSNQGSHLRDASFSSYLDTTERDFAQNLAESTHSSSPAFTPSRESAFSTTSPFWRSLRGPHDELGIFGAKKYFDEKIDVDGKNQIKLVKERKQKTTSFASPNLNTESRWPGQSSSPLLQDLSRSKSQKLIPSRVKFFSGLQCKDSCHITEPPIHYTYQLMELPSHVLVSSIAGKKSVRKDANFTFPVLLNARIGEDKEEKEARKSIEVFGLHNKRTGNDEIVMNLERKLSVLSWDAIPKTRRKSGELEEETESHASSDLFEIPVFPAHNMSPVPGQHEPSKGRSTAPRNCTGDEAALSKEFSSYNKSEKKKILTEVEEKKKKGLVGLTGRKLDDPSNIKADQRSRFGRGKVVQASRSSGGISLGCNSKKAVSVVVGQVGSGAASPSVPVPRKKTQHGSAENSGYHLRSSAKISSTTAPSKSKGILPSFLSSPSSARG